MLIKNKRWKNSILLTLGMFLLIIFLEVIPRLSTVVGNVYDLYQQNQRLKEAEKNDLLEKNIKAENRQLKMQVNRIVSNYEESQRISSIIAALDEIAFENDVEIVSIKPGKTSKEDNLWIQPLELSINSKYENAYNFIRYIENSSKVMLVNGLKMKSKKELNDSLQIIANLEVYLNL